MKTIQTFISFAAIVIQFTSIGCKKEPIPPSTQLPPVVPVVPIVPAPPVAPVANAGADIKIEIPKTWTDLPYSATDADNNIKSYSWKKISGPESHWLEWHYFPLVSVVWMEEGEYEFELTVTDKDSLFDKDTVKVTVFSNLKKYVVKDLKRDSSGTYSIQIPFEVSNNLRWVFAKSSGFNERADAGPLPNIDYTWGGYYYELLPDNKISIFGGYSVPTVDVTLYY